MSKSSLVGSVGLVGRGRLVGLGGLVGAFSVGLLAFGAMLGGCAVQHGDTEATETDSNETVNAISVSRQSFVTLRLDTRRCAAPACGGYFAHDVNSSSTTETYVSSLDFSLSGLADSDADKVRSAPVSDLIIRGKLSPIDARSKTHSLLVTEAYRGMPGVVAAASDTFYTATALGIECFAAPCMNLQASKVNSIVTKDFSNLDVAGAAKPFVDQAWLSARVLQHGAIVAGHFVNGPRETAGYEKVLTTSQIFLRIPDGKGPCPALKIACATGTVNTYVRDDNRCELPTECVKPGICPLFVPYCGDGYTMSSIPSMPNACPKFVCDPTFVTK